MASTEERLALLQILHTQIDDESDKAIQILNNAAMNVNEPRSKSCHEELEAILRQQICEIQARINNLEVCMELVMNYFGPCQCPDEFEQSFERELDLLSLKSKHGSDVREFMKRQLQVMVNTKKDSCSYHLPVVCKSQLFGHGCPRSHQILANAAPVLKMSLYPTDMETVCFENEYFTFVSDDSSGSVRVFNTITGKSERSIGIGLGKVCGLAILKTPLPLLFVSCFDKSMIFVFNAATGVLHQTLPGDALAGLITSFGLCVRPPYETKKSRALLYFCDYQFQRVHVLNIDSGRSVMMLGTGRAGAGPSQFNCPTHLTLFEGNEAINVPMLFVADSDNDRIQVFHADTGRFIKSIGAQGQLDEPMGVALSSADKLSVPLLAVCECNGHRIQLFNIRTGECVKLIRLAGGTRTHPQCSPRGLRVLSTSKDEIAVHFADYNNKRVQLKML